MRELAAVGGDLGGFAERHLRYLRHISVAELNPGDSLWGAFGWRFSRLQHENSPEVVLR